MTVAGLARRGTRYALVLVPMEVDIVHELGHTLGLGHHYSQDDTTLPPDPVPLPYKGIGGFGYSEAYGGGLDILGGKHPPLDTPYDLMGYGHLDKWTSPVTWNTMYHAIAAESGIKLRAHESATARIRRSDERALVSRTASNKPRRRRLVAGVIEHGRALIIDTVVDNVYPAAASGPVSARLIATDAKGRTRGTTTIRGSLTQEAPGSRAALPFVAELPPRADITAVMVKSPKGRTLATLRASKHRPTGRILGLPRRAHAGKAIQLRWSVHDKDHDPLTVVASAQRGNGVWKRLVSGSATTRASVVPSKLGKSGALRVRLDISDGFNTSTVLSKSIPVR